MLAIARLCVLHGRMRFGMLCGEQHMGAELQKEFAVVTGKGGRLATQRDKPFASIDSWPCSVRARSIASPELWTRSSRLGGLAVHVEWAAG
jgi:hypothetical protein